MICLGCRLAPDVVLARQQLLQTCLNDVLATHEELSQAPELLLFLSPTETPSSGWFSGTTRHKSPERAGSPSNAGQHSSSGALLCFVASALTRAPPPPPLHTHTHSAPSTCLIKRERCHTWIEPRSRSALLVCPAHISSHDTTHCDQHHAPTLCKAKVNLAHSF